MATLPKHARGEIHTLGIFNAHVPSQITRQLKVKSRETLRNTVRSLRLLPASVKLYIAFTLDLAEFDQHFRSSGAPEWLNPRYETIATILKCLKVIIKTRLWPGVLKDFNYNNEIDNKFDNDIIRDEIAIDELFDKDMIQIDQKYDKLLALVRFFC